MRFPFYLLIASLLAACATHTINAPVGDRTRRPAHNPDVHVVRQGDTLYSVAFLYGYEVEEVAGWNGLRAPYTIYKGQRLRLKPPPQRAMAPAPPVTSQPKVSPSRPKPRSVAPSRPKPAARPQASAPPPPVSVAKTRPPAPANRHFSWKWPAGGRLLQRYVSGSSGKKGIDIAGRSGAPVRAAAAGKVVYSGSGLAGYGRLIIIKHNKEFLSAYAHNRKLIATEGQWVKQGQVIAHMGRSGTDRVQLHFEIRRHGRPVDPLRYLPRR